MKIMTGFLLLLLIPAAAQAQTDGVFPFGLKGRMRVNELVSSARQNGLVPVTRIDERDIKSITIHPRDAMLANQPVECYHTEFFRDQLWGVNVFLKGCLDVNEHLRHLQELISYVKATYPGNVKSNRLDKLKTGKDRTFAYVLEMKYGSLLVTVISDYDSSSSKYLAAVSYTDMNPGKYLAKEGM